MPALRADEAEGVIYLGSFSKTFARHARLGLAPHAVREKLVLAQESATLCPPAFNQMAVLAASPSTTGRARSSRCGRCTASGATR